MVKKKWIQKIKIKRGSLRRQLGVKNNEDINKSLLLQIEKAPIGTYVSHRINGKYPGKVTKLLKRRVILALNLQK